MAINFPNSPNPNDTHSSGGKTWVWDGTSWKLNSTPATGIGYTDLSVSQVAASGTGTLTYNNSGVFTYTPPNLSGFLTSIPIAAAGTLGGVKIGSNVSVTADGTISVATPYTLPTAGVGSGGLLGGVKVDGTTITISAGVITSVASAASQITVADETTDTSCYVVFVNDTPGGQAAKTGSLLYNAASGQLQAGSFKKASGTSSEFLKADGSIDSNTYLTSQVKSDWNATTGAAEILNKPTIPAAQVQSDWGQTTNSAVDYIKNKPTLFSGAYGDLTGKPSIPSNLNDLSNVDATTNLANGKILKYDLGSTTWVVADDNASGGGSSSFTGLSDTPSAHSNDKWLKSNGSALIWADAPVNLTIANNGNNRIVTGVSGNALHAEGNLTFDGSTLVVTGAATISTDLTVSGKILDKDGDSGTSGQILSSTGTQVNWIDAPNVATPTLDEVTTAGNSTTNNITVNDLNVDGNLTVSGTTTTIDTATLNIADNILTLNSNYSGSSPTANAGIEVERGTAANVALRWNETSDKWQFTNDGSNYSDIGSGSASGTTNLGVTANGTSLTITSDTGNNASIPAATTSAWGAMTDEMYDKLDGIALSANNYSHPNHSGDVTSAGDGATTIANDAVTYAKMQNVNGQKILGRKNTGSGAVAELTPGEVRTLLNVADGAEVNVQSDWNSSSGDSQILNKPTGILTSVPTLTQVTAAGNTTSNAIEVGNCTVTGNLLVDGLVGISDTKITLNSDHSGSAPTADCDLVVERGSSTDVRIRWDESEDKWTATNDGSNYFNLSGFSGSYNDLSNKPTIPTNNNQLTNGAGYTTFSGSYNDLSNKPTIPTNNNQLTNGAGYITSSGSISGTANTAENPRIRTDTGNSYHNLVFVDTVTDNAFQTLKIDNEASALAYNPNQNILIAQALASFRLLDWGNSYGNSGDVLTSKGSSQWAWETPSGGFLGKTKITILTSGTGNHTTESWCKTCWAIVQGGGGGAGNAWGSTGRGGNGGHGGMQINYQNDLTSSTSIPYSVGAGGSRHYSGNCDDNLATGQTGGSSYFGPTNNRGTAAGGGGGAGAYDGQIGANGANGGMRFFASDYGAGGIGGVNTGGDGCNTTSTDGTGGAIFILELG